jgi:hypothetical protein
MDAINPFFLIAPIVTFALWVMNTILTSRRKQQERKRGVFSSAYSAIIDYKEMPYVVRRRQGNTSEERIRISTDIKQCQQSIAYYTAWLSTESPKVSHSYTVLVRELRKIAGGSIHQSWLKPPTSSDAGMNIADIDLSELEPLQEAFMRAIRDDLSCWPVWIIEIVRYARNQAKVCKNKLRH